MVVLVLHVRTEDDRGMITISVIVKYSSNVVVDSLATGGSTFPLVVVLVLCA